jgi:hypothetical protein
MKKLSKKNEALLFHKISVLSSLLLDYLEEVPEGNALLPKYKEGLALTEECAVKIVDAAYTEEVKKSTYIGTLAKQVDTIIRKNYKPM